MNLIYLFPNIINNLKPFFLDPTIQLATKVATSSLLTATINTIFNIKFGSLELKKEKFNKIIQHFFSTFFLFTNLNCALEVLTGNLDVEYKILCAFAIGTFCGITQALISRAIPEETEILEAEVVTKEDENLISYKTSDDEILATGAITYTLEKNYSFSVVAITEIICFYFVLLYVASAFAVTAFFFPSLH